MLRYYPSYIPTTQAVLRDFKDEFLLEELIKGAPRDVDADAQAMNSESSLREKEIEALFPSKAFKSFAPPSASAMADAAMIESFLDNADYQPQSYISDYEFFGFDPEYPRFPTNSPTFQFKSWQVTGMRRMIRILENSTVQACLLADATGLGKTIQIIGLWIWNSTKPESQRERSIQHNLGNALEPEENLFVIPDLSNRPPPAKPILLIVLPELIEQWAAEVSEASQEFHVLIYHGDERSAWFRMYEKVVAKATKGKLTRDHPIFNGDEQNSRAIIITSVVAMRARHGPTALKNYRMHNLKYTRQDAHELITASDSNWAYNLEGLFDHVTVDEAHT